jgi:hypothetical protein
MTNNSYGPTNPSSVFKHFSIPSPVKSQGSNIKANIELFLPPDISQLLVKIEPPKLRDNVQYLFTEMTRLLSYLSLIESKLMQHSSPAVILRIFNLINKQGHSFLDYIETRVLRTEGINNELCDAMDFVSFVLKHELNVIFNGRADFDNDANSIDMEKACRQLVNCFQQSIIALAKVFDPNITHSEIFTVSFSKREQALKLYSELNTIIVLINEVEETNDPSTMNVLIMELNAFHQETMQYLYYYNDREQCELFIKKISSTTDAPELKPLLHQTKCYFETLLKHVRQRSVLLELQLNLYDVPMREQKTLLLSEQDIL